MRCAQCAGDRQRRQRYRCTACGRCIAERLQSAFHRYCFREEVIALAARLSLRYRLSSADAVLPTAAIAPRTS